MTSAQLQLPFDQVEQTRPKPNGRSHARSPSMNVSVHEVATVNDTEAILVLAREHVTDTDLNEEIDEDTLIMSCYKMRHDPDREYANGFVAYVDGDPAGYLVGVTMPTFHNKRVVARQEMWYVRKKYRGTKVALCLLREFERWARLNGATQIFTGTANIRYAEKTSKLLEKLGYARVGALHLKEVT